MKKDVNLICAPHSVIISDYLIIILFHLLASMKGFMLAIIANSKLVDHGKMMNSQRIPRMYVQSSMIADFYNPLEFVSKLYPFCSGGGPSHAYLEVISHSNRNISIKISKIEN